jgi:hypothetical protein
MMPGRVLQAVRNFDQLLRLRRALLGFLDFNLRRRFINLSHSSRSPPDGSPKMLPASTAGFADAQDMTTPDSLGNGYFMNCWYQHCFRTA